MSVKPNIPEQQKVAKSTRLVWWVLFIFILFGGITQYLVNPKSLFNKSGSEVAQSVNPSFTNRSKSASVNKIDGMKMDNTKMEAMEMGGSMAMMTDKIVDENSFLNEIWVCIG